MKALTKALSRLGVPTNRDPKPAGDKTKPASQGGTKRKQCSYCKKPGHDKDECYSWERDQKRKAANDKGGAAKQRAIAADGAPNTDSEGSEKARLSDADPVRTIRAVTGGGTGRPGSAERDLGPVLPPYDVICPGPTIGPGDMPKGSPVPEGAREIPRGSSEGDSPSGAEDIRQDLLGLARALSSAPPSDSGGGGESRR